MALVLKKYAKTDFWFCLTLPDLFFSQNILHRIPGSMVEEETVAYEELLNTWETISKETQDGGCEFLVLPFSNWFRSKLWLVQVLEIDSSTGISGWIPDWIPNQDESLVEFCY